MAKLSSYLTAIILVFIYAQIAAASASHGYIKSNTTGDRIEYFWQKPSGLGPFPALFLIHPDQESPSVGGRVFVDDGQLEHWSARGFLTVAISQPGFGRSEGSADFCGPLTQSAIQDVIKYFRSMPEVGGDRIFVYGGSRGAVVASMIATQDILIRGFILKSGVYNFPEWIKSRSWLDPILLAMKWEIGWLTDKKLRDRSAFFEAGKIKSPVLLIHGSLDDRAPIQGARDFAAKVESSGGRAKLTVVKSEHVIAMSSVDAIMESFMRANLKP